MTVSELIALLQTMPQDLQVVHTFHGYWIILDDNQVSIIEACEPRADGWIQAARPDEPTQKYLLFPGN